MWCDTSCVSGVGNIVNLPRFIVYQDLPVLTRPGAWDTRTSKDSSFIGSQCVAEDAKGLWPKDVLMANLRRPVLSRNWSLCETSNRLLKKESVGAFKVFECSAPIGLAKTLPTSTLKSLWLIPSTRLYEEMPRLIGCVDLLWSIGNFVDWLALENLPEVI